MSHDTGISAHAALTIETHEQLVEQLPEIFRRLNEAPDIARLLLINPLFALEDVQVQLSSELQVHLRRTIGFPRRRVEQIAATRTKLRKQLAELAGSEPRLPVPKTPRERANLLFEQLGVTPVGERPEALTVEQLRDYRGAHPIADTLYELGRLERGALQFHTRGSYDAHKAGRPHHMWLRRLRFRQRGES